MRHQRQRRKQGQARQKAPSLHISLRFLRHSTTAFGCPLKPCAVVFLTSNGVSWVLARLSSNRCRHARYVSNHRSQASVNAIAQTQRRFKMPVLNDARRNPTMSFSDLPHVRLPDRRALMPSAPCPSSHRRSSWRATSAASTGNGRHPPRVSLMEKAGAATAELAGHWQRIGGSVAGPGRPGNNGGDALVAARLLTSQASA